jgi:hypothetical protein
MQIIKGGWKRFLVGFDNHGDKQHKPSVETFFRFMELWKPQIKVHGGDNWDFRPLRKKADKHEREESLMKDYDAGMVFLKRYQPHYFLRGNHDERLWDLALNGTGIEADYASKGVLEITKFFNDTSCKMLPYHKRDGVLRLGHLKILHGFACGVYATRQTAIVYGSALHGHVHTIDEHSIPGLERRVARACGCLCSTDLDYSSRNPSTLRQANGFAYGVISPSGKYHTWTAERVDGKWLVPSDIISI